MDPIRLVLAGGCKQALGGSPHGCQKCIIHGELQEEIYMQKPEGFQEDPSLLCKLKKSLYGLKQAPRAWYAKMDKFMLLLGLVR